MTIPAAFRPTPLKAMDGNVPIVDDSGLPTNDFLLLYEEMRRYIDGMSRVIPCSSSTTSNVVTLTPNDASPLLEGYRDYDVFVFTADATSTGNLTATVVPKTGSLSTLKVYKSDGATQATTGDIVSGSTYLLVFADNLDSLSGGLILK